MRDVYSICFLRRLCPSDAILLSIARIVKEGLLPQILILLCGNSYELELLAVVDSIARFLID